MRSNRRAFFKHFGGLIASVAVAQGVVRKLLSMSDEPVVIASVWDPLAHVGDIYYDVQSFTTWTAVDRKWHSGQCVTWVRGDT